MGWKSWLIGGGEILGGILTANPGLIGMGAVSAGTKAALKAATPALLSSGAATIGAGIAGDASKKAAQTQVDATNKALALQQPYMTAGSNAVNRLDSLMGGSGALSAMGSGPQAAQPMSAMAMPANPTAPPTPWGQTGHNSGRMISMRAPDGSVKAVKASDVPHFQQLGASVIG